MDQVDDNIWSLSHRHTCFSKRVDTTLKKRFHQFACYTVIMLIDRLLFTIYIWFSLGVRLSLCHYPQIYCPTYVNYGISILEHSWDQAKSKFSCPWTNNWALVKSYHCFHSNSPMFSHASFRLLVITHGIMHTVTR